ncbi:MAG: diguanylate cyclase [Gammaproteobacteria bacterium]|nr:diguanylate cyclase [Gammaproteobacteria bacterium]
MLIVDDSRMMRVSLERILKNEFEIIEAGDGEQGWGALNANDTIEVVITDADMPILNGYQLITRIRQSEHARIQAIPIIMITGAEEDHVREKALTTGATDFIVKPPDKTQLLARVRAYAKADRTARKLTEEATTDALTDVSSKRYFSQRGEQDLAFATRHEKELSIIVITIDNFSAITKKQGNKIAKQILVWLANILKDTVRTEDTISRVGDFTFALIVPNTSQTEAITLSNRAKDSIANKPFSATDISIPISASLGLACLSQDKHDSIKDLLDVAIRRVNCARKAGGNKLVVNEKNNQMTPESIFLDASDINQALELMKSDGQSLVPGIKKLVVKIFPLLEFANKALRWELDSQLKAIKEKLEKQH